MARLVFIKERGQPIEPRVCALEAMNTLGRNPNNSIQILDPNASKDHCRIEQRGNVFVLVDAGSMNGTYVNGVRVKSQVTLGDGDEIGIAEARCRFEIGDGAAAKIDDPTAAHEPKRLLLPPQPPAERGFLSADRLTGNLPRMRADYERLRTAHELSRAIHHTSGPDDLLEVIGRRAAVWLRAQRGVLLVRDRDGEMIPRATWHSDGSDGPIAVPLTLVSHVLSERAAVVTHGVPSESAEGARRSAIAMPLAWNEIAVGVLWLDSDWLADIDARDFECLAAVAETTATMLQIFLLDGTLDEPARLH